MFVQLVKDFQRQKAGTRIDVTEPNLKQIELSGYSKVSNTMVADSAIGLEAFLYQLFARAIAWYEDYAFLRGNGTAKPLGIFNWQGIIATTRNTIGHVNF